IIIPFNPWRFQEEAILLRAFFFDVAKKLDASLTTRGEKLSSIANEYADVLTVIPGYGNAATGFVKNWTRKRADVDVNALRERFEAALSNSLKSAVVIMDDID